MDLVWASVDGNLGTADPAFEAHAGPMKYWALAFWESWFTDTEMVNALADARHKLNVKGKSVWARVTGPATAIVATMMRLKWKWADDRTVQDDIRNAWTFGLDSPKDFVSAAHASVRRWRLNRVALPFPQLVPQRMGVHAANATPSIVLDFFGVVAPMIRGKAPTNKMATPRNNKWGSSLA